MPFCFVMACFLVIGMKANGELEYESRMVSLAKTAKMKTFGHFQPLLFRKSPYIGMINRLTSNLKFLLTVLKLDGIYA